MASHSNKLVSANDFMDSHWNVLVLAKNKCKLENIFGCDILETLDADLADADLELSWDLVYVDGDDTILVNDNKKLSLAKGEWPKGYDRDKLMEMYHEKLNGDIR